jgi:diguanylate cyclase (GGDEF)-like protein
MDMAGYRTEIVLNGKVAVEHLAISTPDIVLLDLNLPGVSGGDILVMMNASERLKNVPVVVITAMPNMVEKLIVKPQLVLMKPVNLEQMTSLIQKICPPEKSLENLPWDAQTGLYNRSFFLARLRYALDRVKQLHMNRFAVLYLDLGQSTKLDYLYGSDYNKRVLKDTAAMLRTILRPTDTIARLGGGVFAILIEDVINPDSPVLIAARIQNKIRRYLAKQENELQVRANVGIVLCGEEYDSVNDIMRAAERALALAKSDRKKLLQHLRGQPADGESDAGLMSAFMQ